MIGRAKICLNMIVKNEAKVIARCLSSLRSIVDTWTIVDTGSSDGTQDIIRACFSELPGELHERPWRNFGANRTEALELARNRADYTLIIDADEVLTVSPDFRPGELELDAYQLRTELGELAYYRTQLIRSGMPWRWEGVLHEYLECDLPFTQSKLEGLVNRPTPDGARSSDPLKYLKDAALLEEALKERPNNARDVFYLAQSYRDAGLIEAALKYYKRRVELGGWEEEVWYAMYQVARMLEAAERPEQEVLQAYLEAYERRPSRAEPLSSLARYFRLKSKYALAHLFAKRAVALPTPSDLLFVDASVYAWRARDECSIAAYYLGQHEDALALTAALLADPRLPAAEHARVAANREFSVKAITAEAQAGKP
jgi:glycosyltransferase involved in cell wall biosynthesis